VLYGGTAMASKLKSKNKFITIRVNSSVLKRVDRIAKEKGIERSNLIREAIESYIENKILLDIPQRIKEQLDRLSRETGATPDRIVTEAIYKYLWKVRAEKVREKLIPVARQKGIVTEEDVFRRVS
jgi:predicted DNA-binding protein